MWKFSYSFRIMAVFYFINWIVAAETIEGGKLFKGGNYSWKYGIAKKTQSFRQKLELLHIFLQEFWSERHLHAPVYCKFVESYFLILQFILFQHTVLRQPQIGRAVQLLFKRHLKVPLRFLQVRKVIQTSLTA